MAGKAAVALEAEATAMVGAMVNLEITFSP
jgi:hypothetical protein